MPITLATHRTTRIDSRSPPRSGGTLTRAEPPRLANGFGALIEQESDLKSVTESYLRTMSGPQAAEIASMLWEHQMRLETNLTLLEQRYQTLPSPARFRAEPAAILVTSGDEFPFGSATESLTRLPGLLALHQGLLAAIEALLARHGDGQRGEMILAQVGQNHDRMAGMITALISREPIGDPALPPIVGARPLHLRSHAGGENEVGATSASAGAAGR